MYRSPKQTIKFQSTNSVHAATRIAAKEAKLAGLVRKYLHFMDKKFDMMNPDGFFRFNGPIFSFNLLWVWYWGVATGSHILVSMEYKFA